MGDEPLRSGGHGRLRLPGLLVGHLGPIITPARPTDLHRTALSRAGTADRVQNADTPGRPAQGVATPGVRGTHCLWEDPAGDRRVQAVIRWLDQH